MPLITISQGIGCGGMEIADLVAKGLKIERFDDLRLQEKAIAMGLEPEELKADAVQDVERRTPRMLGRLLRTRSEAYLDYLQAVIYEVAKIGEGIIIGHGSQVLLHDFHCALHVHIYAGESTRSRNLMKQMGVSEDTARKLLQKSDHEQEGFFQFAFHMDWKDPSLYDLVINTEQIGSDLAAKIVMEVAASDDLKACSLTALDAMEKLSLKKRIHAAFVENNVSPSLMHVAVPEKGVVEIIGAAHSTEEKTGIINTVKAVPGVSKVEENIVVLSDFYAH
jgi:cytidylate kinase